MIAKIKTRVDFGGIVNYANDQKNKKKCATLLAHEGVCAISNKLIADSFCLQDVYKRQTMGWFYGFKLYIVINDRGEIIQWTLTPGNVDDREPLKEKDFTQRLFGKTLPTRDT